MVPWVVVGNNTGLLAGLGDDCSADGDNSAVERSHTATPPDALIGGVPGGAAALSGSPRQRTGR
jgi:hypothetical protein